MVHFKNAKGVVLEDSFHDPTLVLDQILLFFVSNAYLLGKSYTTMMSLFSSFNS